MQLAAAACKEQEWVAAWQFAAVALRASGEQQQQQLLLLLETEKHRSGETPELTASFFSL